MKMYICGIQDLLWRYKRHVIAVVLTVLAVMIAISLFSFVPTDGSWFYHQVGQDGSVPLGNKLGVLGAHLAATLIFLFGGAAILFVPLLLFVVYLLLCGASFAQQWERVVAGVALVCVYGALSYYYHIDVLNSPFAGGYVGYHLIGVSQAFFDTFTLGIFLHVLLVGLLTVTLRFSYMPIVRVAIRFIAFIASPMFLQPVYRYIRLALWTASRPVVWLGTAVRQLFAADAVHNKNHSILEFERGIKQATLKDDDFWKLYVQQEPAAQSETFIEPEKNVSADTRSFTHEAFSMPSDIVEQTDQEQVVYDTVYAEPSCEEPADRYARFTPPSYELPSLNIFIGNVEERDDPKVTQYLQDQSQMLEEKLKRFGVTGKVVAIKRGPVVTLFEYKPDIDAKISKITALEDDLALALQALSIRIIAPIPGKSVVGFEVANKKRKHVYLSELLHSDAIDELKGTLPLALGHDTVGNNIVVDLVRMPHLLIAGSTGSGKSVALNTMLVSLLCKKTPDELKLILIDPKRLEFASYGDIAHLLFPIVTHPKKAAPVLKWVVQEMEERYEKMAQFSARNVKDYNNIMQQAGQALLPYIVVIIDELADLMMTTGKEIEDLIARIAQMARAAGIHLIVATQRPSVDVITGLIKVNFPSRISFRVTSKIDSRTILDCSGADKLLGQGDMLFLDSQDSRLRRLHGAYVSDAEIQELVAHIKSQREVCYLDLSEQLREIDEDEEKDVLYDDVLAYLEEINEVSISLLQRKFRIGYNRSARIIDLLEAQGIIGPSGAGKTRSVLRD